MTRLYLDLETYSEVPITNGTYAYAAGAEVMLFAWAIDDGPVSVHDATRGGPLPPELHAALADETVELWAHNVMFDRTVLRTSTWAWGPSLNAARQIHRWRDTMVQALAHSLPGSLGTLCEILKLPVDQAKDKEGKRLVQLFCKPRPANSKVRRATRETHPEDWARFVDYARLDIEAMRECHRRMPTWNYPGTRLAGGAGWRELCLWHLDQAVNDRGVAIDRNLVQAAIAAVDIEQHRLAKRTQEMTDGQVESATKRDALLAHILEAYGVDLPDLQAATLERRIADPDLPIELRDLLGVRLAACTTSVTKYKALARGTSADGRLRGTLQFCGAGRTARWAGRLFQPQNLPRPTLGDDEIELGIDAMLAGCADLVADDVMQLASSAIRGTIVAPVGRKLVVADLANIEGRDAAWLAGEAWKLDAFREYDAGTGPDLYKLAYSKSFRTAVDEVTKPQRQIGKVQELMLGYEGGVGAFMTGAATYGFDVEELGETAFSTLPAWAAHEAGDFYDWTVREGRNTFGLSRQAFVTCDAIKRLWRDAHPAISSYWPELRNVVTEAIERPGTTLACRKLKVRRDGAWLRIGLPSGRALCYPSPQVIEGAIAYMGVNQYSRKWGRLKTYGGKLFENVCQAVARDVMAHNMPAIQGAGYDLVLTVHDEVICEAPDEAEFNAEHLASLLAATPPWADGMPLAAAGFETYRYKKD